MDCRTDPTLQELSAAQKKKQPTNNRYTVTAGIVLIYHLSGFLLFITVKKTKNTHKQIKLELPTENSAFSLASDSSNFIDLANFQLWKQEAKPLSKTILKLLLESYF